MLLFDKRLKVERLTVGSVKQMSVAKKALLLIQSR